MGVVQFEDVESRVGDYFMADFIACYDSLKGYLNLELGLKFLTEV